MERAYANCPKILAQHYLLHLLRDKLVESHSRIVVVSSGAVRRVDDGKKTRSPEEEWGKIDEP